MDAGHLSRAPAVAGSFYPANVDELKSLLRDCFVSSPLGPGGGLGALPSLLGGMVPHAGFIYSGACAAHLYAAVPKDTQCVVILGVNHRGLGARAALTAADSWETPLGSVRVEQSLQGQLMTRVDFLCVDDGAHFQEHSIEVQLPFLQTVLSNFEFLPVSLGTLSENECARLGRGLAEIYEARSAAGKKTILIASSDLSHYLPPDETERLDAMALEQVLALDGSGLLKKIEEEDIGMCGVIPTSVLLFAAKALGAREARLFKYCHSGHSVPMREVVGYASVAIEL